MYPSWEHCQGQLPSSCQRDRCDVGNSICTSQDFTKFNSHSTQYLERVLEPINQRVKGQGPVRLSCVCVCVCVCARVRACMRVRARITCIMTEEC